MMAAQPFTPVPSQRHPGATFPNGYAPAIERAHSIVIPATSEQRAWVAGNICQYTTYATGCYACHVAAGQPWQDGAMDDACKAHAAPPCPLCWGKMDCLMCGGLGEILPRNLMAHHFLSSPGAAGDHAEHLGFILPIVPLHETFDPHWLAAAIERTRDAGGHPLSCEQLLIVFDFIDTWAASYEPGQVYWRLAAERVITLIGDQLRAALPGVRCE